MNVSLGNLMYGITLQPIMESANWAKLSIVTKLTIFKVDYFMEDESQSYFANEGEPCMSTSYTPFRIFVILFTLF